LLEEDDISETIDELIHEQFRILSNTYVPLESIESQWRTKELDEYLQDSYSLNTGIENLVSSDKKLIPETIEEKVVDIAKERYLEKYNDLGNNRLLLEKQVMLQVLDVHWKEHLAEIDHLRNSVGLRAYAQKNPKNEFKKEAYSMFESMLSEIDSETIRILFSLQISTEEDMNSIPQSKNKQEIIMKKDKPDSNIGTDDIEDNKEQLSSPSTIKRDEPKLGRNDLVKITNGKETLEMKYKKAKLLIDSGDWNIL
jgi:preprotein translocase subunit SecA